MQNPVAVLSTLLLISYSKILQAIIVPLSYDYLTYYNSSNDSEAHQIIWLYDGSIGFFKEPIHIALGLFAILSLVVFIIPYISLLLFGHRLQGCSNWWILSWLNKIKPFMDAYHAPYRKHTRYWTGLLLLSRLGLFLTFAINANGSESVNLVAVSSVSLAFLAFKRRVYEHRWKDLLESSLILNLGIVSVATFYIKEESKKASHFLIMSISAGITFIIFIGILSYHICMVFKSTSRLRIWEIYLLPFIRKPQRIFMATSVGDNEKKPRLRRKLSYIVPQLSLRLVLIFVNHYWSQRVVIQNCVLLPTNDVISDHCQTRHDIACTDLYYYFNG